MKNQTFAAYRHIGTDAIHILDLALFSNKQMSNEDGATSLACEYINEDGEQELAIIWSGCADEPGVTYLPLTEDQNRYIMNVYIKCPIKTPTAGWGELVEVVGTFDDCKFAVNVNYPDHVIATVEFIEPENA